MKKLEELHCTGCDLGPKLLGGILKFSSNNLKLVFLDNNKISNLEQGAITGALHFKENSMIGLHAPIQSPSFLAPASKGLWIAPTRRRTKRSHLRQHSQHGPLFDESK
ncbi:unnamed protein product, partial [Darwinula stevensoni]